LSLSDLRLSAFICGSLSSLSCISGIDVKRSPFTALCGRLAQLDRPRRADLHVHTTASDGEYTPQQVVAFARQANLVAVAITDHDTFAAVEEARAAASAEIEVIAGVEITAEFAGREVHLLGYFVRTDHQELNAALGKLCERRRERFWDFVAKLAARGSAIPTDRAKLVEQSAHSLGRRHVAGLLVACRFAFHRTEAFHRFVAPLSGVVLPKQLLPIAEAIRLVREACGVSSLAHPPTDLTDDDFRSLAAMGLDAVEVEYPWGRTSPAARLREIASRFGFAKSGGSDCHGPDPAHRRIGSQAISLDELNILRGRSARVGSRDS
jgi:predicted metal-dependent phosphoesterase TrpH